jgi:hypothetical protein
MELSTRSLVRLRITGCDDMARAPQVLNDYDNVTLDSTGYGTVQIGPHGMDWKISYLAVKATPNTVEATVKVYRNVLSDYGFQELTNSGSSGDNTDTIWYLHDGEFLIVEWSLGYAGAVAVVTVKGLQTYRGEMVYAL